MAHLLIMLFSELVGSGGEIPLSHFLKYYIIKLMDFYILNMFELITFFKKNFFTNHCTHTEICANLKYIERRIITDCPSLAACKILCLWFSIVLLLCT